MRVRLFAAIADAAGARELDLDVTTVPELLARLAADHGELMAARLTTASVWVDEVVVAPGDDSVDLSAADEVVVVPPFAGGAGPR